MYVAKRIAVFEVISFIFKQFVSEPTSNLPTWYYLTLIIIDCATEVLNSPPPLHRNMTETNSLLQWYTLSIVITDSSQSFHFPIYPLLPEVPTLPDQQEVSKIQGIFQSSIQATKSPK